MKWKKIGSFGVDSGQFMICDPCYLEDGKQVKLILEERFNVKSKKNIKFKSGFKGLALIGNTVVGDGLFAVYERTYLGRREIKIRF